MVFKMKKNIASSYCTIIYIVFCSSQKSINNDILFYYSNCYLCMVLYGFSLPLPQAVSFRRLEHVHDGLLFGLRDVGVPYVDQQYHAVLRCVVPDIVVVGIVQYHGLVLLVGPDRGGDADPAFWQPGLRVDRVVVLDNDRQVDPQAQVRRRVVGRDLGPSTEVAKESKAKGSPLEQLVVVFFSPQAVVENLGGFGEFHDKVSLDVSLGEVGVPVPVAIVQGCVLAFFFFASAATATTTTTAVDVVLQARVIGGEGRGDPQIFLPEDFGVGFQQLDRLCY